jgi:hypothetical protein
MEKAQRKQRRQANTGGNGEKEGSGQSDKAQNQTMG